MRPTLVRLALAASILVLGGCSLRSHYYGRYDHDYGYGEACDTPDGWSSYSLGVYGSGTHQPYYGYGTHHRSGRRHLGYGSYGKRCN